MYLFGSICVQIVGLGIVTPLAEELMFRGVLFGRCREQMGFYRAAIWSSLFFSMIHGNMIQMVYALALGMFLCYAYEKFGSLKASVLLHIYGQYGIAYRYKSRAFNLALHVAGTSCIRRDRLCVCRSGRVCEYPKCSDNRIGKEQRTPQRRTNRQDGNKEGRR